INHQVTQEPVQGREAIRAMFEREFSVADMTCIVEAIHEAGDVVALEWRDPRASAAAGSSPSVRDGSPSSVAIGTSSLSSKCMVCLSSDAVSASRHAEGPIIRDRFASPLSPGPVLRDNAPPTPGNGPTRSGATSGGNRNDNTLRSSG